MYSDHTQFTHDVTPLEPELTKIQKIGNVVDRIAFGLFANNLVLLTAGLYAAWHVGTLAMADHLEGTSGARAGWTVAAECHVTGVDNKTRIWEFAPRLTASERRADRNYVDSPAAAFSGCDNFVAKNGYKNARAAIGLHINGVDGMYGDPDGMITGTAENYRAQTTPASALRAELASFRSQALANDMETRGTLFSFSHAQYRWEHGILPGLQSLITIRKATPRENTTIGQRLDTIIGDIQNGRLVTVRRARASPAP